MEINLTNIAGSYRDITANKHSRHSIDDRINPSLFQYDYLALSTLSADIARLIEVVPKAEGGVAALDIGCGKSPYRKQAEERGYTLKTLDIDRTSMPDHVGTIEKTGLPDGELRLVLCTQVLEHASDPQQGLREIMRILQPGGWLIASVPHVWFYHPHPEDNWRFTQEGLVRLMKSAGFAPKIMYAQGGSILTLFQVINFLVYGVVGKFGAPLYAVMNVIGKVADKIISNNLFCHNFAILVRKPA